MNKKITIICILLLAIITGVLLASIRFYGNEKKDAEIIGVIMPGSVSETGWNGVHYAGIQQAASELGVKISLKENVKEFSGNCTKAIEELIAQGAKMIILGSYNYSKEVRDVIKAHPEVKFFCCSSSIFEKNYYTYFARVYQARYLSGIVAGLHTKSNIIGYVAAMNNNEVNRGINAFTLGVQKVNPKAKVIVTWTDSWDNAEKEKQNVHTLVEKYGADVISYHQNQTYVLDAAEKLGVYSIGYNEDKKNHSNKVLTSITTNWSMVYKELIQDFLQKKDTEEKKYWIGIEKNAVQLAFYSDLVSDSTKQVISETTESLKNGSEIFSGKIIDNQGHVQCDNEVIDDSSLQNKMDWFIKGVEIHED